MSDSIDSENESIYWESGDDNVELETSGEENPNTPPPLEPRPTPMRRTVKRNVGNTSRRRFR